MPNKVNRKNIVLIVSIAIGVIAISIALFVMYFNQDTVSAPIATEESVKSIGEGVAEPSGEPVEPYRGVSTAVADSFSIKAPNGWSGSVSTSPAFLGIMFARPNQLGSLVYDATASPVIDYNGIPSWGGLTEHFFVIAPTASRAFNPSDHLEVTSEPFIFDNGTVGQYYYVVKHAEEAQKWGGLQKDTEWQGRVYVYEKDGKRVEAHLALYPSTEINVEFYENVVRSLRI